MAPFLRALLAVVGISSHLAANNCPDGTAALLHHYARYRHHRHHRRDFVWTEVHDSPQDLCGNSTFQLVVPPTAAGGRGPEAADCTALVCYARSRTGFWLVTGFGASGLEWAEFDVLGSCKLAVRHADGGGGTISIGNTDIINLIESTMAMFPGGKYLPQVQGNMTCSQTSTAVVEWKLYGE